MTRDQLETLSRSIDDIAPMRWKEAVVVALILFAVVAMIIFAVNGGWQ